MNTLTISKGEFTISTDKKLIDTAFVHQFLTNDSYWAKERSIEAVKKSIENSCCFCLFFQNQPAGFARVITDYVTMAYLADVFIIPKHRGKGLSKWLLETIMHHPNLQDIKRWILLTADAHSLYQKFGFNSPAKPDMYMEKCR